MHRSRRSVLIAAAVLAALVGLLPSSRAAAPGGGSVDADNPSAAWTGGPFVAANPTTDTDCVVAQAPFCDSFALTVGVLSADRPDVVLSVTADSNADIVNVAVYDAAGRKVAESGALGSTQTVVLAAPTPGVYDVRTELLLGIPGSSTYRGTAVTAKADAPVDLSQDCLLEETDAALEPDLGQTVDLDVLVLLDGVDAGFAARFFEDVKKPYADLNVRVVPTFQVADPPFVGDSTVDIINQARARYPGGKVPAEYDVVEILTSKDIQALGQYAIAGQADCLGGLAWDQRSYNVSEAVAAGVPEDGIGIGPLTFDAKFGAKVTAHEIGHLLGGQHHYANCAEGVDADEELSGDTSPCTLMANFSDVISLKFGALNGAIVRGYALRYAAANDAT